MKKWCMWGVAACVVLAFASCKSSESAYKKAYEKAKQQELAEPQVVETVEVEMITPVVTAPVETQTALDEANSVRQEKVTVVSGSDDSLNNYSVICGSFGLKANAEGLKDFLIGEGYSPIIVFNPATAMYRVAVSTFADRAAAIQARNAFKARFPNREDFQTAWILNRL